MKKLLRVLGMGLMILFGACFVAILFSFPRLITGMEGTPLENIALGIAMLAAYGGLFWLGRWLYGRSKAEVPHTKAVAKEASGLAPAYVPNPRQPEALQPTEKSEPAAIKPAVRKTAAAMPGTEPPKQSKRVSTPTPCCLPEWASAVLYSDPNANRSRDAALESLRLFFRQGEPCVEVVVGWNEGYHGGGASVVREVPEALRRELTSESLLAWMREVLRPEVMAAVDWGDRALRRRLESWCRLVRDVASLDLSGGLYLTEQPFAEALRGVGPDGLEDNCDARLWLRLKDGADVEKALRGLGEWQETHAEKWGIQPCYVLTEDARLLDDVPGTVRTDVCAPWKIRVTMLEGTRLRDLVDGAEYVLHYVEWPGSADDAATYGEWWLAEERPPQPTAEDKPSDADRADALRADLARLPGSAAMLPHLTFADGSVQSDFCPGGVPRMDQTRNGWKLTGGWDDMRGPQVTMRGLDRDSAITQLAKMIGSTLDHLQSWSEYHPDWLEPQHRRLDFYGRGEITWKNGRFLLRDGTSASARAISRAEARKIEADFWRYQASQDIGRAGEEPEKAFALRGFVIDGDGRWTRDSYDVDGLVPRWKAEQELFHRPRERVLLAHWGGKAEHTRLEVYLDRGAEAADLTFIEQSYDDAGGQAYPAGTKVFCRAHATDALDRQMVFTWIQAALKEESLGYYDIAEEQVQFETGEAKRRAYRLADFTRDAKLTPEPDSQIVPSDPCRIVNFALDHVTLSEGRVVCALLEEVMVYDSSAFSLYALSLEQYRQLLETGVLDEATWRWCVRQKPICVTHSQNDGYHGAFSGPGPKPNFVVEEVLPLAVSSKSFRQVGWNVLERESDGTSENG